MSSRSRGVSVGPHPSAQVHDEGDSSDYGPDFASDEEELLNQLLERAGSVTTDDKDSAAVTTAAAAAARVAGTSATADIFLEAAKSSSISGTVDALDVDLDVFLADIEDQGYVLAGLSKNESGGTATFGQGLEEVFSHRAVENPESPEGRQRERLREDVLARENAAATKNSDNATTKSPLERLRRPPRKGLSVTDLVSPSWCELQYWYTLTKFGKKKATPAMRQGTAVHKKLEEQVHTPVPVEVTTKEDGWALRIWNVIQGLHTLRTTGMTREMEVWGVVDGEVVTGIIDMLSYECPDPDLDNGADAEACYTSTRTTGTLPPGSGASLTDVLSAEDGRKRLSNISVNNEDNGESEEYEEVVVPPERKRIYITDVKTRGERGRVPYASALSFRPTLIQLHLYYHLLERLITTDDTTINTIAARHGLEVDKPFSDAFIAQVGEINDDVLSDVASSQASDPDYIPPASISGQQPETPSSSRDGKNDPLSIILQHNSLSSLWALMKQHLKLTFAHDIPQQQRQLPQQTTLSPLLTASYFSTSTQPMAQLGHRSFFFDAEDLYPYLSSCMNFWRGRRPARGVAVYEAWKCRNCDFRDECEWRKQKEDEHSGASAHKDGN